MAESRSKKTVGVSFIIPIHNSSKLIEQCVQRIRREMKRARKTFEIILAEDGSTDDSPEIVRRLGREKGVYSFSEKQRLGRGKAITRSAQNARGNLIVYTDVDCAADLNCLPKFIEKLENSDVVIGSRYAPGARASRSVKRLVPSIAYNCIARLLFRTGVHDHQCGLKGFRKQTFLKVAEKVRDEKWFWDTEFIIKAKRMGFRLEEFPVEWKEKPDSTVDLMRDSVNMLAAMAKLALKRRGE